MKYLIYIGPGIGDWIIALPMARRIKLNDPNSHIMAITKSNKKKFELTKSLLLLQQWIDKIDYYSMDEPFHDLKLLLKLGYKKYDFYFRSSYYDNCYVSAWPNRIMKIAAKKGVGVHLENKPNLSYDYEIPFKYDNSVYKTPLDLLERIGIQKSKEEEKYELFDVSRISKEFLKFGIEKNNIIVIIPGAAKAAVTADGKNGDKPAKNWPYEYWEELASKLSNDGYQIILLGGEAEKKDIEGDKRFNNSKIINLCGKTTVIESCAVLSHSLIVIGADTGMMHCAGAVGTPSLTLFGCTDYRNYLAYGKKSYYIASKRVCSPCFGGEKLLSCNDFLCMREISVEEVYTKVHSILKKTNSEQRFVNEN